ncbi:hypothetical protein DPMN_170238 [Dreissena polymorpha]|uniref:Uncharacterized protein n=1 Tax=Dreissena polymorpha TaxID=45954 RepID=A0A9D4IEE1_DREPO|nr:hypothetical protein DPMN_170238 [Dreissena polymorpha]
MTHNGRQTIDISRSQKLTMSTWCSEPVLGVFGGDLKNAPMVGIEPVTSPVARRTPYPLHHCDLWFKCEVMTWY